MATELDILLGEVKSIQTTIQDKFAAGVKPLKEELDRMAKAVEETQVAIKKLQLDKAARINYDGRLLVATGKLAGYDMLDLRLLESIIQKTKWGQEYAETGNVPPIVKLLRENRTSLKAYLGNPENVLAWEDTAMRRRMDVFQNGSPALAKSMFHEGLNGWTRDMISMVTRALDSTTTAKGDELVPTLEAAELWMDVNLATMVLPLLPQLNMPSNPFDWPTQFGDTNWYPNTENVQVTTTDPATNKTTLTAYGLKTGVPFSDELEEDSIVALVPELRRNLVRNAAEIIDDVILNADTATTNSINADGATISKTTAGKAHWLLGFKGILELPLVGNTTQKKDQNAALTASMFNQGQRRLGKYGVPQRRGDVVFVADINTALVALTLAQVETMEKIGMRATISTGELASIYGNPLIMSAQMKLADTDGKITSAGNATATGRILTTNVTQWKVGFRRQVEVETVREAGKGQTTMYLSFRIALTERTGTRSTATHTALEFDITGVS